MLGLLRVLFIGLVLMQKWPAKKWVTLNFPAIAVMARDFGSHFSIVLAFHCTLLILYLFAFTQHIRHVRLYAALLLLFACTRARISQSPFYLSWFEHWKVGGNIIKGYEQSFFVVQAAFC